MNNGLGNISRPLPNDVVAWVVFDGRTGSVATVLETYRIANVTRTGTGAYTIDFDFAMPTEYYAFTAFARAFTGVGHAVVTEQAIASPRTTTSLRIQVIGLLTAPTIATMDSDLVTVVIFGAFV